MTLFEKYAPKTLDETQFHFKSYELLKNIAHDTSLPHILIHGPKGVGKNTAIRLLLREIFDESVNETYETTYKVSGSSNKTNNEVIKRSPHHIIIEPKNTNYDKYLIHFVAKKFAELMIIKGMNPTNKKYNVIQINNLDQLSDTAQSSLRCTIEKYTHNCRFIMWCNSLGNVMKPIQSRCVCIRLEAPSCCELYDFVSMIIAQKRLNFSVMQKINIVSKSDRNIKNCLWNVEYTQYDLEIDKSYDLTIRKIVSKILKKGYTDFDDIRSLIFNLTISNFSNDIIIRDIVNMLLKIPSKPHGNNFMIEESKKILIVLKVAECEHNLVRGRRGIKHFDYAISSIINILHN